MSKKQKKPQNTPSDFEKRAAKKEAVLGSQKPGYAAYIVIAACVVVVAGGAFLYKVQNTNSTTTTPAVTTERPPQTVQPAAAAAQAQEITYPTTMFLDGQAKFFEHKDGDITIKYFILKSSDGVIRAAFDACDVCWPAGKGYYQDGDYMVCRNCGRRFKSVLVNEVSGGCNPAPLNRTIKDFNVVIQVQDILEGRNYFDFSQHS